MIGHHGHACRHLDHRADPGNGPGRAGVEGLDCGAEHGWAGHHRGEQAWEPHVDAELGAPGGLLRRVQTLCWFPDKLPVLRILERHRLERRQLGGGRCEFTVRSPLVAGDHYAVLGAAVGGFHSKALRRCLHQQRPGSGTGLAVPVEFGQGRRRATGHLQADRGMRVHRRGLRVRDLDLRPIGVQLLSDKHRQRGPDSLAHFGMREQDGDAVIAPHPDKRIRCKPSAGL